jgi:hypothetical protein
MKLERSRKPVRRAAGAVLGLTLLAAPLGACSSGGSDSRGGTSCMDQHDEKLWDNSRLSSQRLNEIIDCWSQKR